MYNYQRKKALILNALEQEYDLLQKYTQQQITETDPREQLRIQGEIKSIEQTIQEEEQKLNKLEADFKELVNISSSRTQSDSDNTTVSSDLALDEHYQELINYFEKGKILPVFDTLDTTLIRSDLTLIKGQSQPAEDNNRVQDVIVPPSQVISSSSLGELAAIVNDAEGQQDLLEGVLRQLKKLFPAARRRTIALYEDNQFIACEFSPSDYSTLDFNLAQRAIKSLQVVSSSQLDEVHNGPTTKSLDKNIALCAALQFNGQPLGVIYLDVADGTTFLSNKDAKLLEDVAVVVSPQIKLRDRNTLHKIPSVFISYVREDREWVTTLSNDLRRRRIKVWYDKLVKVGEKWSERITQALEANDAFVLVMSETSLASNWVMEELSRAHKANKPIIPLMYERCEVPEILAQTQYLDPHKDYEKALEEIVDQLYKIIESAPAVVFAPSKPENSKRNTNFASSAPGNFIGREDEIEDIKNTLQKTRLLTLTGAGGTGKTRLAFEVGRQLLNAFPDGVWKVELATIRKPEDVALTVAKELANNEQFDILLDYLKDKELLLILDNCEHMLKACARVVVTLLETSPGLRILATSREALSILEQEQTWRVPSLKLPTPTQPLPMVEELLQYDGIKFFVERALLVKRNFQFTKDNAFDLVQLCHQLDGIPLALQLAAARVEGLSIKQIHLKLNDRFQLLTGGDSNVLLRQQTLVASIDWSYDLLSEAQQLLLERLSVFVGGWTLEAVEAICPDENLEAKSVVNDFLQLIKKSLVVAEEQAEENRYRLLESIKEYARQKLAKRGETKQFELRHCNYYLQIVENAEPQLVGSQQAQYMAQLEQEHYNIRAALGWCLDAKNLSDKVLNEASNVNPQEIALRMGGALWRFWWIHGYLKEGRKWIEQALKSLGVEQPELRSVRAKALSGVGVLCNEQGDYRAAQRYYEESLAILRELEDKPGIGRLLNNLGVLNYDQGNFSQARSLYEESLSQFQELGNDWATSSILNNLGAAAQKEGDLVAAQKYLEEALTIKRNLADTSGIANTLSSLGDVLLDCENYFAAEEVLRESLTINQQLDDPCAIAHLLEFFGGLAAAQVQAERALLLAGAANKIRQTVGVPLSQAERIPLDKRLASARQELSKNAQEVWRKGHLMSLKEAVDFALEI